MNQTRGLNVQSRTGTGNIMMANNPFFGLLPREYVGKKKEFFTYNIRFNTIAAGGTSTLTANVQNDSDFVWVYGVMTVTNNLFTTFTSAAAVPMLIELADSASGVQLQDSPTHVSNVFGTIQLPHVLVVPKIFRAGGQISARLQNQDGANAFVVNLSFHGFKVYNIPA